MATGKNFGHWSRKRSVTISRTKRLGNFTVVTEVEEILPAIHAAPEPDEITLTSHL